MAECDECESFKGGVVVTGFPECVAQTDEQYIFNWYFTVSNFSSAPKLGSSIAYDVESYQSDGPPTPGPGIFSSPLVVWSVQTSVLDGTGPGSYLGTGVFFDGFTLPPGDSFFVLRAVLAKNLFNTVYLTVFEESFATFTSTTFPAGSISIGAYAATENQDENSISIGHQAGLFDQGAFSIAAGFLSGASGQNFGAIAVGPEAGFLNQGVLAVAVGSLAGNTNQQCWTVAIGAEAGELDQEKECIAVGRRAGASGQQTSSVALGYLAGENSQGENAVAVGDQAGNQNQGGEAVAVGQQASSASQGLGAVSLGDFAGQTSQGQHGVALGAVAAFSGQGQNAVAIGSKTNPVGQGASSIAIGAPAAGSNQHANTIVINTSGTGITTNGVSRTFVRPVRELVNNVGQPRLQYRGLTTREVSHARISGSYVPELFGTISNPTIGAGSIGAYVVVGGVMSLRIILTPFSGGAGDWSVSLPPGYNHSTTTASVGYAFQPLTTDEGTFNFIARQNAVFSDRLDAYFGTEDRNWGEDYGERAATNFIVVTELAFPSVNPSDFILGWRTTTSSENVRLPFFSALSLTVNWGDGNIQSFSGTFATGLNHTYADAGRYTVTISGSTTTFNMVLATMNTFRQKLVAVIQFGQLGLTQLNFSGASLIGLDAPDMPQSTITNMSSMFANIATFNSPAVSNWDVSNVTNMSNMFNNATSFNQPLSSWDTSNVTTMQGMFTDADAFNQNLSWDLSSCTTTATMFSRANVFNGVLDFGTTFSSVTTVQGMFGSNTGMGYPFNNGGSNVINNWDVSSVTNFNQMFHQTAINQPLDNWDVSSATTMTGMFFFCSAFNQSLSAWSSMLGSVTTMASMFISNHVFNNGGDPGIEDWDVSSVATFSQTFQSTPFNQPVTNWDTSSATVMNGMFALTPFNQNVSHFNTSSVTTTSSMFAGAASFNNAGDPGIQDWDVSSVTTFLAMFNGATVFNQPLTNWLTSSAMNMQTMFQSAVQFNQNISHFITSGVTSMQGMFGGVVTNFNNGGDPGIQNWDVSSVSNFQSMFSNATSFNQPLTNWNTASATNMQSMFNSATIFNQNISHFVTSGVLNMQNTFTSATNFNNGGDDGIEDWDVSSVTNFIGTFLSSSAFNQPLTNWDTGSAIAVTAMFQSATSFNQNISHFDTSSVTTMWNMLRAMTVFNNGSDPGIANWDVSNATNFEGVFFGSPAFNQPLTNWTTTNAAHMVGTFAIATSFNGSISNFDTSGVASMLQMFDGAAAFNQPVGHFDTSNATNMQFMFRGTALNQDISSWPTMNSVTNLQGFTQNNGMNQTNYNNAIVMFSANTTITGVLWSTPTGAGGLTVTGTDGPSMAAYAELTSRVPPWVIQA